MNTKIRILLGIGLIVVAMGIGYLLYRVFFATSPIIRPPTGVGPTTPSTSTFPIGTPTDREPGTFIPPGTLPPTGIPGVETQDTLQPLDQVRTVFTGTARNLAITPNGQPQFYNANDGRFYRIGLDGTPQLLSDEIFFSADQVTWDTRGDKAIIEYPDGSNIVYNFTTQQQVTLPRHWEDFSFSNDGNQIAAKSLPVSPENRWLVATDATGNNIRLIEPLGNNANKVIVDWSANSQVAAFSRTGQALGMDREEVLLIGLHGENFKSLIVEGRDFRPKWTPDGKQVLYSVYSERSDFRPELWIVDASGNSIGERRTFLNINTWADKCDFGSGSARYVYCGVPETLERGAGFVPEIANTIPDSVYRIDTQTGARTPIVTSVDEYFVVDTLRVDEANNRLFVTDKRTQAVLQIDL